LNPAQPAFGGGVDAFVTRLDAAGSPLYSTYLGGGASDVGTGIAVDSAGAAYVTGQTSSGDFPVVNPLQPTIGGGSDAFVAKLAEPAGATADLAVTKTGTPDPVAPGSTLSYSIAATNNGPDAASDVMLADELPPYTTFLRLASPAGWSCTTPEAGGTGAVTCTTSLLAPDKTETFTVDVQVDPAAEDGTHITNAASAGTSTSDPDSTNNSATVISTVMASGSMVADLSTFIVAAPEPVVPGSTVTYGIAVTNNGPDAVSSVTVADEIPLTTTFRTLDAPEWACTTPETGRVGTVSCTSSFLQPGKTAWIILGVSVDQSAEDGTLIKDTVTADSPTTDPDPANNSATVTAIVSTMSPGRQWHGPASRRGPREREALQVR